MKILITNKQESLSNNINVLTIVSTEMNTSSKVYILDRKEIGIIKYSDTEEIFLIKNIESKFQDSNQEILIEIKDTDLEGLVSNSEPVDSRPYKVYTALLTQSGTDAPVATVLENTLGGDVVWSYENVGVYNGTLVGAFTENKTYTTITMDNNYDSVYKTIYASSEDAVQVQTYDDLTAGTPADTQLYFTSIEIKTYN